MEISMIKSCLTDKPLKFGKDDSLSAVGYANALAQFILNADTPVTIGIQGGWGSGKTSLISVLQEMLDNDPDHHALCVLVNAWEHSLFHSTDGKAEVALSLLNGLARGITNSVKQVFDAKDARERWLDDSSREVISPNENKVEKAIAFIRGGLKFVGKIGIQAASNMLGSGDMSHLMNGADKDAKEITIPPLAESVHALRAGLSEMIGKIKYKGQQVKIVFFIDDLDRVPPPTAVEILDITKNIFDIPDCIFVLAIDYEVVVKGLEEKFGEKNEKNEREFRQYFDKIIQIPFTMPMGAYGDKLVDLLRPAMESLGYEIGTDNSQIGEIANDARLATGGIPRSIKRIINTLSLLQHIDRARKMKGATNEEGFVLKKLEPKPMPKDLEARFIVVGLHINFPEICRRLMEKPDFPQWTLGSLDLQWHLNAEKNKKELDILGQTELFDDDWEKVVYCLCAQSDWLKSQAINVSRLLNRLLVVLDDGKESKSLDEEGLNTLNDILEGIKVVSIDSETVSKPQYDDKSVKTDRVTMFFAKLQDMLSKKLPNGLMPMRSDEYAKRGSERNYDISLNNRNISALFQWLKDEEPPRIDISFIASRHGHSQKKSNPILEKMSDGFEIWQEGGNFYYYFSRDFEYDDFLDEKSLPQLADEAVRLYNTVNKAQKALEEM